MTRTDADVAEELAWLEAVSSEDMVGRLAYADWLEERDRPAAAAFWRWAAKVWWKPRPSSKYWVYRWPTYYGDSPKSWSEDFTGGDLPAAVFDRLTVGDECTGHRKTQARRELYLDKLYADLMLNGADGWEGPP